MKLTADIVSAFVGHNHVPVEMLKTVMKDVHRTMAALEVSVTPELKPDPAPLERKPAVSIKASVKDSHMVSQEIGKPYKSLSMHLKSLGMTPGQYRSKWGLPLDYPMVASAQSKKRSDIAKQMGLGRRKG